MPCFHPIEGYRTPSGTITFNRSQGYSDVPVTVPCGQCIGCRIARKKAWAARCIHEAQMHDRNCFLTLTYDEENVPPFASLYRPDLVKFKKRLRERLRAKHGIKIKTFECGEYGESFDRPHYHLNVFGWDFPDKTLWKRRNDNPIFLSDLLEELWPYGYATVGHLTYESAAYTAGYVLKKVTGKAADKHYEIMDVDTGELFRREPEYCTMSKGIGSEYYDKYKTDLYPDDFIIVKGRKHTIPKYYDNKFQAEQDDGVFINAHDRIKLRRRRAATRHKENNTPARLATREEVIKRKLTIFKREL
ncbi:putative replication initiation protein [Eel River basin pequenovirus]|nr:putative replication initiation protein [Eel River basin pequenovirus]